MNKSRQVLSCIDDTVRPSLSLVRFVILYLLMFLFMHFVISKRSPETFWFTLDLYVHSCMHIYHSQVNMMNRVLEYCDRDLKIQIKITTLSHIAVEVLSG